MEDINLEKYLYNRNFQLELEEAYKSRTSKRLEKLKKYGAEEEEEWLGEAARCLIFLIRKAFD